MLLFLYTKFSVAPWVSVVKFIHFIFIFLVILSLGHSEIITGFWSHAGSKATPEDPEIKIRCLKQSLI